MVTPVNVSYSAASGEGVYGGRLKPSVLSLAASALAVGDFVQIAPNNLNIIPDEDNRYPNEGRGGDEFTDWSISGVYDTTRNRVYISGAPAGTVGSPYATTILSYDIAGNSWEAIRDPWGVAVGHCYDATTYSDDMLYKSSFQGGIYTYNMNSDTVGLEISNPPTDIGSGSAAWATIEGCAIHPNMGVSGSLIWSNSSLGRTCRYDIDSEVWTLLNQTGNIAAVAPVCHYSSFSDLVVYGISVGGAHPLYMVDSSEVITTTDNAPAEMYASATGILFAADPNSPNSLLITDDGDIYNLSHSTGAWTLKGTTPIDYTDNRNSNRWIAPVDGDGVFIIVDYAASGNSKVYLYRNS